LVNVDRAGEIGLWGRSFLYVFTMLDDCIMKNGLSASLHVHLFSDSITEILVAVLQWLSRGIVVEGGSSSTALPSFVKHGGGKVFVVASDVNLHARLIGEAIETRSRGWGRMISGWTAPLTR
jgi:hypothetical protein